MVSETSSAKPEFFCVVIRRTFWELYNGRFHQIWLWDVDRCPVNKFGKTVSKFFTLGVICPQNLKSKVSQTGTSLKSRLQVIGCPAERYCLFHVVVQRPGSFHDPVNFSVQRMVAELRSVKLAQFFDFCLFSPYKTPKTYLPMTSLQCRGYIAEWFRFFHVVVESPRGWSFPATSGRGAGDPQTCPNFHIWQMAIPIQNTTIWHFRYGTKMSENAQFWGRMYFPRNIPFWGPFNAKPITESSP